MSTVVIEGMPEDITIRTDLRPGDIGYLTYLHGDLYAKEYGWDYRFEAYVAGPLAAFALDPKPDERIWIVERHGLVAGAIAIVRGSAEEAQLRWLLLHPSVRGCGAGRTLVDLAVSFSREEGYRSIFLWTVSELAAARGIYKAFGFELTEQKQHLVWGAELTEERYDLQL